MTELHSLFVRRVRDEMRARGLNPNKLEEYGVKQRTLADVLLGADPRLSTIHAAARALGMKASDLLREGPDKRVINLSDRRESQSIMGAEPHIQADERKKRHR